MTYKKKLIEVALPLDAINRASLAEKSQRKGHVSSLHLWWARRPTASARAVLFSQLIDDPSANPDLFPTAEAQADERRRLFGLIEGLALWEPDRRGDVLAGVRRELEAQQQRDKGDSDGGTFPTVHDPFAGGGSIPLASVQLGLRTEASDLNPIAVLLNRAALEIPAALKGQRGISKSAQASLMGSPADILKALAEDVRVFGESLVGQVQQSLKHYYPGVQVTDAMARERADLATHLGKTYEVLAWIWCWTVESPNPALGGVHVPLCSSFELTAKKGSKYAIHPHYTVDSRRVEFEVVPGDPEIEGTVDRSGGRCLISNVAIPFSYIREQGRAGLLGQRLMAIVAKDGKRKVLLSPSREQEEIALSVPDDRGPAGAIPDQALGIRVQLYGFKEYREVFSLRQRLVLDELTRAVAALPAKLQREHDASPEYSRAVATYIALAIGRYADYGSMLTFWDKRAPSIQKCFGLPTMQMRWSYPETNPFSSFSGNLRGMLESVSEAVEGLPEPGNVSVRAANAVEYSGPNPRIVATDPPYYDNIGYAALSDYFYVWLRQALKEHHPDLFSTILTPKSEELVAEPGRHESRVSASRFFEDGFFSFAQRLNETTSRRFPTTIYYAFKQEEGTGGKGRASTGWETFLSGLVTAGWEVVGTWPLRTEQSGGLRVVGRNSLASSVVLVCRPRDESAPLATRKELTAALRTELPGALRLLQEGNLAPVDLAQASIGPGMAVFSRYAGVLEADGSRMPVRSALELINRALDEVLEDQENDLDSDTRWAIGWYQEFGFAEGPYGVAETLSKAKNTSVSGIVESGIAVAGGGKVRLKRRKELDSEWNPSEDDRFTVWEMCQYLVRRLEGYGEYSAGDLLARAPGVGASVRDLAYRLFAVATQANRADEAAAYNNLISAWPEILRIAADGPAEHAPSQLQLDSEA